MQLARLWGPLFLTTFSNSRIKVITLRCDRMFTEF